MIDEAEKGDTSAAGAPAISTSGHIIEPLETRQAEDFRGPVMERYPDTGAHLLLWGPETRGTDNSDCLPLNRGPAQ